MFSSYGRVALAASWLFYRISMAETAPNPIADPFPDPADPPGLAKRQMIPTPTTQPTGLRALTALGCYSTNEPLVNHGPWTFQWEGNCQPICWLLEQPVMGLVNGTDCYCGPKIPPVETKVDDALCNTPCAGIDTGYCGGNNLWTVYNTGFSLDQLQNLPLDSLSSAGAKTSSTTGPATTLVVTQPPASSASSKSGGSSKVGIAVDVVIGVVAIVGIIT